MTHILISISLIEKRIELVASEAMQCRELGLQEGEKVCLSRMHFYQMLKDDKTLKQISLNEEEIRRKATIYSKKEYGIPKDWNLNEFTDKQLEQNIILAYEQALKDLL